MRILITLFCVYLTALSIDHYIAEHEGNFHFQIT